MKAALEKMPPGSPSYDKVKATIEKIEIGCKDIEEDSFGYLKNGALDIVGGSDLKNPLLDSLTAFTEKKIEPQQKIDKAKKERKKLEAAAQNLENQKTFVLDLLNRKLKSCSVEEQQKTKEILAKMLAEDEESKVGFKLTLIGRDNNFIQSESTSNPSKRDFERRCESTDQAIEVTKEFIKKYSPQDDLSHDELD